MQIRCPDESRIFISIASFCDPMLMFTIKSALDTARYPGRLSFGIVDQSNAPIENDLPSGEWRHAYLHVDPHHSRGACWARALAMTLYTDEEYFFQIDSHTLFEQDWDVTLIEVLERISKESANRKILLSTRPFAFEIEDGDVISKKRFTATTLKLTPKDPVLKLSEPVMKFAGVDSKEMRDIPGFQISAAFLFTRGQFVEEIPYDPFLYFHGEEQNISIRAFSHGWDIWHPNRMPLYHLYKTRAQGEAPLHWDPQFEVRRKEKWLELRSRAHRRLADLVGGKLVGVYGLGSTRSIQDYLQLGGLQLEN
jgi:hypothetical protein